MYYIIFSLILAQNILKLAQNLQKSVWNGIMKTNKLTNGRVEGGSASDTDGWYVSHMQELSLHLLTWWFGGETGADLPHPGAPQQNGDISEVVYGSK